jgi:hypothetical protein
VTDYFGDIWLVRVLLQRGLAAVYLVAFIGSLRQFPALLGERGLLPVPEYLAQVGRREAPSLFHFHYSDSFFRQLAWSGCGLSALLLCGLTDWLPLWLSPLPWLLLWVLYLSVVNVGQAFYSFGWETMLLEAGFFVAFLGPSDVEPPLIPVLLLRFMLLRTELGAGLIKLRHDSCWRDLTCLYYHYETQPLPNPFSWYFHWLPRRVHRAGVLFSHFVQVVLPFVLFFPQPLAAGAGALIIAHQLLLIVSGNYSWLNWLTVVLGVSALDGALLGVGEVDTAARDTTYDVLLCLLAATTVLLSRKPVQNLLSRKQRMNVSHNSLHLVNSYGAFGAVTRERRELIVEGTRGSDADFREYGFHAKPGDPTRRPPWVAPYHLRLDWALWFLPLRGAEPRERWFVRFMQRLLGAHAPTLALLRHNPFPDGPPHTVRALLYTYRFSTRSQRKKDHTWWTRELIGEVYRVSRNDSGR